MNSLPRQDIDKKLLGMTQQLLSESGQAYLRSLRMDDSLQRQLSIDSLMRAELFQRIGKEFSVEIPDKLIAEAETLNDIADFLQQSDPTSPQKKIEKKVLLSHGERPHLDPSHTHSLIDVLLLYGEQSPDKPHIYFQHEDGQEEIITYGQLLKNSKQVAHSLKELGLKEGETVAIMQPTNPGFFYTFFGTLLAGGIPVPIYPPFRMHMLEAYAKTEAHILRNAEVRVLVTFAEAEKLSLLLKTFVPSLKYVKTVSDLMNSNDDVKIFHASGKNFAFIQYTSGSTSEPKGVLLSHYNLLANIRGYGKAIRATADDVAVSWLPLYHDMGLIGMWLGSLYYGAPLVLLTPFSFLNHPEKWLWAIHYHRGTLSGAPNFAYELCVRKVDPAVIEGLDLSSWRMAANGAEKIYPRTLEEFAKKFAPYGFKKNALLPVYGLAESTVGLAIPPLEREFRVDQIDRKLFEEERKAVPSTDKNALEFVGCGMPIEGHDIRIVDENFKELPERNVGLLQFRGPSMMQGYYNNPKATEAIYHDGWMDSGDFAYLADGEVFITGRSKDLIIKAGRNIYPAELEEIVGNVKGTRQGCIAAFGYGDHKRGTEKLIVVAETRETRDNAREKLIEEIQRELSTAIDMVADEVVLVAPHTVPKTSSGKLQRSACKKMYEESRLQGYHKPAWLQIANLSTKSAANKAMSMLKTGSKMLYTAYIALVFAITLLPVYLMIVLSKRETAAKIICGYAKFIQLASGSQVTIVGEENLPKTKPVIYAANHASFIDTVVLLALLPTGTRFIGKRELLKAPIIGTFMRKLDFLAVDRIDLSKGIEDAKQIENVLRDGHSILIFPEGTFGYAVGLRPFRLGAFKMAVETNTPICPIALQGTRTILRGDEKVLRPGIVTVTISKLIKPAGNEWQDVIQLRNAVRAEIADHCGEPSLDFIAAQAVAPKPPKS